MAILDRTTASLTNSTSLHHTIMQTEMEFEAFSDLTPVQQFYYQRNIFITGGSGLVGKVLIEKLLRCCPGIGMLFIMMRPKRDKTIEERAEDMFNCLLFNTVKKIFPGYRQHIRIIYGDLDKERLGLSDDNFELIKEKVSIVFHSAAQVKFNEKLKVALQCNTIGTIHLLNLCKQMPHLDVIVHVSTSFVKKHYGKTVLERVPKLDVTSSQLLSTFEWINDEAAAAIEKMLLTDYMNSYLYTKSLTEIIIDERHGDMPTAIVRPCTVGPTVREPFGGWMDAFQSMSGLFLAAGKGVLRCMHVVPGLKLEIVPADVVANHLIVAAYHKASNKSPELFVMNCTMDMDKIPPAIECLLDKAMEKRLEYPLTSIFRYPDFTVYYSTTLFYIHAFFDHWIPAIFADIFIYIFTGRTILCKVHKKIMFLRHVFVDSYLTGWNCIRDNHRMLMKSLSEKDNEIFFMNADDMDWDTYIDDGIKIGRIVLGKEDPSSIPYAKKKAWIWWFVTTLLKWCIIFYVLYLIIPRTFFNNVTGKEYFLSIQS